MTDRNYRTLAPEIVWDGERPRSAEFSDYYWSQGDPRLEKRAVFADQHHLAVRAQRAEQFVLLELGFGFGHNFLQTAELWSRECTQTILHYIAIERAPPSLRSLERVYSKDDSELTQRLLNAYPPRVEGWFTQWISPKVRLTLIFEDARTALPELDARVDAFYLDGFKPSHNPELFNSFIFERLHRLAQPGATLSTYSVAGVVKQGLTAAGFAIEKRAGFGQKRALLYAQKQGAWAGQTLKRPSIQIVGAGLAGRALQQSLSRFGQDAMVFSDPRSIGSSDQPRLKLYPQVALQRDAASDFSLAASHFALQHNPLIEPRPIQWHSDNADRERRMSKLNALLPDTVLASSAEGFTYHLAGIWRPGEPITPTQTGRVERIGFGKTATQLIGLTGKILSEADTTIIAAGMGTLELTGLDLRCIQGQSMIIHSEDILPNAMTGDLNITALGEAQFLVGSTYCLDNSDPKPTRSNTNLLCQRLSKLLGHSQFKVISEHSGVRVAYPDRKIGFGPIHSRNVAHSVGQNDAVAGTDHQSLYVLTGLGSHGLTHSSLAAEAIISKIVGAPNVTPRAHLAAFRPDRALRKS